MAITRERAARPAPVKRTTTMNRKIDRILAICTVGLVLWLSVATAGPVEKKSGNTRNDTNLSRTERVIVMGAPDTETGISPSTSPNLDDATAPSWEGEAPSALTTDSEVGQEPVALSVSALYQINWQSINIGGETSVSPVYTALQSIGQETIGQSQSASFTAGQGYWYGTPVSAGPPSCACDCHGDPAPIGTCDGNQDVLDVVQTVNVAFRGAPPIIDPNANCPYETTDTNCSQSTDVIDVVKMVNVAFRGANRAAEFCDPCP